MISHRDVDRVGMEVPELIPARMLNEFAYCPRLCYLEWVQGEWADNLETQQGSFGHRRVDQPTRKEVPEGAEAQEPRAQGQEVLAPRLSPLNPPLALAHQPPTLSPPLSTPGR